MKEMLMWDKYNNKYRKVIDVEEIKEKLIKIINDKDQNKLVEWYNELIKEEFER